MTMLCPRLIGRDRELEVVEHHLALARSGQGAAVALVGEPGVGKSRLVREIATRARSAGSTVLVGRATENGTAFRPLAEVLLAAERAGLDRQHPSLHDVRAGLSIAPGWDAGAAADERTPSSELLVGEAVLRCLRLVRGDVVVILEDVHWADPSTREAVAYLVDHVGGERVAVVVTLRPAPWADEAKRQYSAVLELAPLPGDGTARMVEACLNAAPPAGLVDAVAARTGGVPFLVEELLAALADAGALRDVGGEWSFDPPAEPPAPFSVVTSIAARLDALGQRARDVIRQAAAIGREIDIDVLARAAGMDEEDVVRVLRSGVQAQLLGLEAGAFQFRHMLTRDAVVQSLPPSTHKALARHGLQALLDVKEGDDAGHLHAAALLARVVGDAALAAELFMSLAEVELCRTHTAAAESALREALAIAPAGSDIEAQAQRLLFKTLATAGETGEALELGKAVLARAQSADDAVSTRLLLARSAAVARRDDEAEALLAEVQAMPGVSTEAAAEARVIAGIVAIHNGQADQARRLVEGPASDTALDPALRCEALSVLGRAARNDDPPAAAAVFTEELEVARAHGLVLWTARALHELGTVDLLTDLRTDRLYEARQAAVEARAAALICVVDLQLAALHIERMELDEAVAAARRSREVAESLRLSLLPYGWALEAVAAARAGRAEACAAAVRRALAAAGDNAEIVAVTEGYALGMLALVEGRLPEAVAHLHTAAEAARALGNTPMPFRGIRALLLAAADDAAAADAIEDARRQRGGSATSDLGLTMAEAVAAGAAGDAARADELVREFEARLGSRLSGEWVGHICRTLAAEAAQRDGWGEPLSWLRGALAEFESRRQPHLAEHCRRLLRTAGAPVPRRRTAFDVPPMLARMGVTGREAEILALVARGASNRQIADELVLSPRTVEKHIENLTVKTGTRRAALAALAESAGLTTG